MKKENNCAQDFIRTVYHIKAPSKETNKKLYNFCLAEILSIIRLSNLKRSIDVTSLEEVTNIQVLLPKPIADKMY